MRGRELGAIGTRRWAPGGPRAAGLGQLAEDRQPLAGEALGLGDLAGVHFLGDRRTPGLGFVGAAQGRQVEPFVGRDEIHADALPRRICLPQVVHRVRAAAFRVRLELRQSINVYARDYTFVLLVRREVPSRLMAIVVREKLWQG